MGSHRASVQRTGRRATMNDDVRGGWTSASNAQADAKCPGRYLAQKGIPEPPRSEDAKHGDAIHKALAVADPDAANRLTLEQHEVFEACRAIEKKVMLAYFGEGTHFKLWREQRYWVKIPRTADGGTNGNDLLAHSGQFDLIVRAGSKALIIDYKTLSGDVAESPRNLQLRDGVVLVRGHLVVDEVAVAIVQPLVTHTPEVTVYSAEEIDQAEQELFARVRASHDPKAQRIAGDVQCKYCRAKPKCGAYQQSAAAMVPALLHVFEVPFAEWPPEQLAMGAGKLQAAYSLLEQFENHCKALLEVDPDAVPGFYLKPGAVRETITDLQALHDRFIAVGGGTERLLPCLTAAKGKVREAVAEVTGLKGKALSAKMDEILTGIVEEKQNKPSLTKKDGDA